MSNQKFQIINEILTFKNELGNKIEIRITKEPKNFVKIIMVGPYSTSSNLITRLEAEMLEKELSKFLKNSL